jgi:hypothetical protein
MKTNTDGYYKPIQGTKDYSQFILLKGNRDINHLHLNRLIQSIQEKYIPVPILVNEKYEIIDGQHRWSAVKHLGFTIYYHIEPGLGLKDVHRLNTNMRTWTAEEYLDGYCDLNYPHYIQFRAFKTVHKFGQNECMAMLTHGGHPGGSLFDTFKKGAFKIYSYEKATEIAEKITAVGEYYEGYKRRNFVFAMLDMFKNPEYSHNVFLQKLSYQSRKLTDQTTIVHYKDCIRVIYNYKNSNPVVV